MLKRLAQDAFGTRDSGPLRGATFAYRTSAWTLLYVFVILGMAAVFHRSVGVKIAAVVFGVLVAWQWWGRVACHYSFSNDLRRRDKDA